MKNFRAAWKNCAAYNAHDQSRSSIRPNLTRFSFLDYFHSPGGFDRISLAWTLITGKIDFLYWLGMRLAFAAPRVAGVKVKLVGLNKIDPAGTYIFMSNHVSNLDPPILVPVIPGRTSVLAKREIWKIPIVNKALDLAEIVPVERSNRDSAISSIGARVR